MLESYDREHQTGVLVDANVKIWEGLFLIFSLDGDGLHTPGKGGLWALLERPQSKYPKVLQYP